MGYYDDKRKCFLLIDSMIQRNSEGIEPEFLYYEIATKYGYSQKIVDKRLELLTKIGKIKYNLGVFQWNGQGKK